MCGRRPLGGPPHPERSEGSFTECAPRPRTAHRPTVGRQTSARSTPQDRAPRTSARVRQWRLLWPAAPRGRRALRRPPHPERSEGSTTDGRPCTQRPGSGNLFPEHVWSVPAQEKFSRSMFAASRDISGASRPRKDFPETYSPRPGSGKVFPEHVCSVPGHIWSVPAQKRFSRDIFAASRLRKDFPETYSPRPGSEKIFPEHIRRVPAQKRFSRDIFAASRPRKDFPGTYLERPGSEKVFPGHIRCVPAQKKFSRDIFAASRPRKDFPGTYSPRPGPEKVFPAHNLLSGPPTPTSAPPPITAHLRGNQRDRALDRRVRRQRSGSRSPRESHRQS
jgi:hypothetical protein